MLLKYCKNEKNYIIKKINLEKNYIFRLKELGFLEGSNFKLIKITKFGGVITKVDQCYISFTKKFLDKIEVQDV